MQIYQEQILQTQKLQIKATLEKLTLQMLLILYLDKWSGLLTEEQIAQIHNLPDASEEPMPKVKANITKKVDFYDPGSMDDFEGSIEEYINEDNDNMVIVYRKTIEGKTR